MKDQPPSKKEIGRLTVMLLELVQSLLPEGYHAALAVFSDQTQGENRTVYIASDAPLEVLQAVFEPVVSRKTSPASVLE